MEENKNPYMGHTEQLRPPLPQPRVPSGVFKFILLGISLLVAILLAGVGYYVVNETSQMKPTPTGTKQITPIASDPLSNWKTYTNKKYNYSFEYPSQTYSPINKDTTNWVVEDDSNNGNAELRWVSDAYPGISPFGIGVGTGNDREQNLKSNSQVKQLPNRTIAGQTASVYLLDNTKGTFGHRVYSYSFIIHKNGYEYLISQSYFPEDPVNEGNIGNGPELVEQILSTFKFLDETDTSGMKTYSGKDPGGKTFELKYHDEWVYGKSSMQSPIGLVETVTFKDSEESVMTLSMTETYLSVDDYIKTELGDVSSITNIRVEGIPGKEVVYAGRGGEKHAILFKKSGILYNAAIPLDSPETFLNQVKTTFRFVESISPQPTQRL